MRVLDPAGYGYLPIPEVDAPQLEGFTCGKQHLDHFLTSTAIPLHEARLGFTSVVFHQDAEGPIGYFTLANDAIPLEQSERLELGLDDSVATMNAIPALKIGRLAVRSDHQGGGVGSFIMQLILGHALNGDGMSSSRLLVVDADNDERVLAFYRRNLFEESLWARNKIKNNTAKAKRPTTIKMHRDVLKA